MRETRTSGSEGGGGICRSLPLSEEHDAPPALTSENSLHLFGRERHVADAQGQASATAFAKAAAAGP